MEAVPPIDRLVEHLPLEVVPRMKLRELHAFLFQQRNDLVPDMVDGLELHPRVIEHNLIQRPSFLHEQQQHGQTALAKTYTCDMLHTDHKPNRSWSTA